MYTPAISGCRFRTVWATEPLTQTPLRTNQATPLPHRTKLAGGSSGIDSFSYGITDIDERSLSFCRRRSINLGLRRDTISTALCATDVRVVNLSPASQPRDPRQGVVVHGVKGRSCSIDMVMLATTIYTVSQMALEPTTSSGVYQTSAFSISFSNLLSSHVQV